MFLSKLELLDFGDSNDEATEAEQVDHAIGDLGTYSNTNYLLYILTWSLKLYC